MTETRKQDEKITWRAGDRIAFHCSGCEAVHEVVVSGAYAWGWNGSEDAPTFTPSVLVQRYNGEGTLDVCHSFVRDGRIEYLGDCTHALAGQTLPLPSFSDPYMRSVEGASNG